MPTPEQLRSNAERLRELATVFDRQAKEADGLMSDVEQKLGSGSTGRSNRIWSGPAPDQLEEEIRSWIVDASDTAGQLGEYANMCRVHADQLDEDATMAENMAAKTRDADGQPVPRSGGGP